MRATAMTGMISAAMLLTGGCAGVGSGPARTGAGEEIRYQTSACFGTCPVYSVTVRADGTGRFEGERFTATTGARDFTVPRADYQRFAAALAPYRPRGERLVQPGSPDCANPPTDMPGVEVHWSGPETSDHLAFYNGCRAGNEAMAQALRQAPDLLPIAALIGKR